MRGVIITPEFKMEGQVFILISSSIDPARLRQYVLYWDIIDLPDNNLVSTGASPEVAFLESIGLLTRTKIRFNSWDGQNLGYAFAIMQAATFELNSQKAPGTWSIAQPNEQLHLPQGITRTSRTVEVELYNSIPVPAPEVPLERVLEFKERRRDELREFRQLMDEFYLEIISSADLPRAKNKVIDQIQTSIINLNKLMGESKIKRLLGTVKVELNISDSIREVFIGGLAGHVAFNMPPEVGAAIGLATSVIKVGMQSIPRLNKVPDELRDYAYIYHSLKELE